MNRPLLTISLSGLPMMITLSGIIGWSDLGILLFVFMIAVKDIPVGAALLGALVGLVLHTLVCIVHQAGHALAARHTGYPMRGWLTFWIISASVYPRNEPELPAETHIQRALGGQYFSLPLLFFAILAAFIILPNHGAVGVLAGFFVIDTLAFSLGALIPMPILETDGRTLLYWWPRRNPPTGQSK